MRSYNDAHGLSSLYVKRRQPFLTDGKVIILQSTGLSLSESLTDRKKDLLYYSSHLKTILIK